MELIEAGIFAVAVCFVGCLGCIAWIITTDIKQQGIDRRAAAKGENQVSASPYRGGREEWWQPMLVELLKNPQIQEMIAGFLKKQIEKKVN